ncbi:Double-strand break repair protein MRE11 [Pichia kudriavzevii]|uniref:Double-strand break repair protein n=1 Tax=Pichia kudriavzevii TaxID=4909 RepID=A0A1V2LLZ2_PICKU|nr:Double-strand break repair protein MRE11 [Pichia kudriavzevii]
MPEVTFIEPGPDTFRILLTTDNHVGYMENDQIRGDDSWKTFAEILSIGRERDVDFILQGGDLFHVNSPTKKSYYHVMRSLREHCWCDKPIEYKLVSDPSDAMAAKHFTYPAEYDMNVNVGMPLYAISGNHDDATGEELLSPLDVLGVSGLLNHFGRVIDNEQISICPLLFNKGSTNLALYGLHSIREERLMKTMASGNLEFLEPDTGDDGTIQWFNLMCIHQNHVHRPGVKVVEETSLPTFLDFILWGHEHDCRPVAMRNDITGSYILQAGSSIATSLTEGETLDKHVYILSIKGKDFSLEPIKLKTVRPFVMKDVILSRTGLRATSSNKKEVLNFLMMQVELMIEKANSVWKENNVELFEEGIVTEADIPLPLIRLRVEYSGGYEVENPRYFSNRFVGKVANVNDVVLFYKKKKYQGRNGRKLLVDKGECESDIDDEVNDDNEDLLGFANEDEENNILGMINDKINDQDLILLTKKKVSETLENLVEHDQERSILNRFVQTEEEEHIDLLEKLTIEEDSDTFEGLDTGSVKDVKKSFRELAKRIRIETQLNTGSSTVEERVGSGESADRATKTAGPVLFNAQSTKASSSRVAGEIPVKGTRTSDYVVNSESEKEEEAEHETRSALFDIPLPESVRKATTPNPSRGSTSQRGRARTYARPKTRVNAFRNQKSTQNSLLDVLMGKK